MSSNTKIYIPINVPTNRILQVIAKIVDDSSIPDSFSNNQGQKKSFNAQEISSKENPWHLALDRKKFKTNNSNTSALLNVSFEDIAGNSHNWYLHLENEDEEHKQLMPSSHALAVAVGIRLVDFFGGKVVFNDEDKVDDPNNFHYNNTPKMPKKLPEQSSDDRWHQFQNLLIKEPLLTSQELILATTKCVYNEKNLPLINFLSKKEFMDKLDAELPQKEVTTKKLKI